MKPASALPRLFYERSSTFGYLHSVPDLAAFFALLWIIATAPLSAKAAAAVAIGVVAYRMTFILHDCCHATLFASRRENQAVGWLTAALLLTSYPSFRRQHFIHHQHYRRADDPQGVDYNGLVPGRDRILRHLLAPLVFLMAWERLGSYFALNHSGMSQHERAAAVNTGGSLREHAMSGGIIAVAQLGVMAVSTAGFTFWPGYFVYLLSLSTIGLFLSRLRSYLEHGNLSPDDESRLVARTHLSNLIERNVLAGLSFNYHHEHHLWPQVPSRWLPTVHREYTTDALPPGDFSRSYVASLRQLVRASRATAARG